MKLKLFLISLVILLCNRISFSQTCGTVVSISQKALEDTFTVAQANPNQSLPQLNRDLSVAFYLIKDTLGNTGITQSDINAAILRLNQYFSPIALKFHSCSTINVDNYQFDNLNANKNEKDLTILNFLNNVINIYVVASLTDSKNTKVSGYTYMPADNKNFVFISKTSFNSSEIGHQIGHLFNLYHTHETLFNNEYVDGSNCATTGDKCCDTEADPNLTGLVDNCVYIGKNKDSNPSKSLYYKPSVKNLMSLSQDECRCFFSPTQFLRIVNTIQKYKNNLK